MHSEKLQHQQYVQHIIASRPRAQEPWFAQEKKSECWNQSNHIPFYLFNKTNNIFNWLQWYHYYMHNIDSLKNYNTKKKKKKKHADHPIVYNEQLRITPRSSIAILKGENCKLTRGRESGARGENT